MRMSAVISRAHPIHYVSNIVTKCILIHGLNSRKAINTLKREIANRIIGERYPELEWDTRNIKTNSGSIKQISIKEWELRLKHINCNNQPIDIYLCIDLILDTQIREDGGNYCIPIIKKLRTEAAKCPKCSDSKCLSIKTSHRACGSRALPS